VVAAEIPTTDDDTPAADRIATLEDELAALQRLAAELEVALYGEPVPWPDDVPPEHRPERFTDHAPEVMAQCEPAITAVATDCSEPPCYLFVRGDLGLVNDMTQRCEKWTSLYGQSSPFVWTSIECKDGTREPIQVVSVVADWVPEDSEGGFESNDYKRSCKRVNDVLARLPCKGE